MNSNEKALHLLKQNLFLKLRDQNQEAVSLMIAYDAVLVSLCADKLEERDHPQAADLLRKMNGAGEIT